MNFGSWNIFHINKHDTEASCPVLDVYPTFTWSPKLLIFNSNRSERDSIVFGLLWREQNAEETKKGPFNLWLCAMDGRSDAVPTPLREGVGETRRRH